MLLDRKLQETINKLIKIQFLINNLKGKSKLLNQETDQLLHCQVGKPITKLKLFKATATPKMDFVVKHPRIYLHIIYHKIKIEISSFQVFLKSLTSVIMKVKITLLILENNPLQELMYLLLNSQMKNQIALGFLNIILKVPHKIKVL